MKKTLGLLGIVILTAIIAFSITSCPEPLPDPGNNNNDNGTDYGTIDDSKITAILNYLKDQTGGASTDDPVNLSVVGIDLGITADPNSGWQKLLAAIKEADKFVELDLSACTVVTPFGNASNVPIGEDKIVSLILPDTFILTPDNGAFIDNGSSSTSAFRHYTNLKSVTGREIGTIGQYAFYDNVSLTTADFPNAQWIGHYAFRDCTNLTSVNIPETRDISPYAFAYCSNLTDINFPNAINIYEYAFIGSGIESAKFPKVKTIPSLAFANCKNLKSARFPEVTDIADVASIGQYAFYNCTELTDVYFPIAQTIGNYAFSESGLVSAEFPVVTVIGQYAFYNCTELIEADFPIAHTIGNFAFSGSGLESVNFPEVTLIHASAFRSCINLTEIVFPAATYIAESAFRNCTNLRIARFHANTNNPASPSSPNTIIFEPDALRECSSLEILDIRNAWNVLFYRGALADITGPLEIHLFDDDGTKSNGHPQTDPFLGHPSNPEVYGNITLRSITIIAPIVSGTSQIQPPDPETTGIFHYMRGQFFALVYNNDEVMFNAANPVKIGTRVPYPYQ